MEIGDENYRAWYDSDTLTVFFEGVLRLPGTEVGQFLSDVLATNPQAVTLDVRMLSFTDDAGINTFYKFAISASKQAGLQLTVLGSKNVIWQAKALPITEKYNKNCKVILE